ncbi:MAG: hypothetical protein ABWZ52_05480 [Acidimicrobiales bacterium]
MTADVTRVATGWMDQAWDDEAGLLWNPPGSFEGELEPRVVHLVRETAWYAIGLLRRDGPGDRARAGAALAAVIERQYDEPRQPWPGTFVRFPEWPAPAEGATEWIDYDPNWRQFVGTALAVAVSDFDLPAPLRTRARAAIDVAVASEPPDRVPPTYSNIALLRSWLEAWSGCRQEGYAAAVVDAFLRHGCFTEYGSPTYYGIDLLALGLWQRSDADADLRRDGARLEAALWTDVARWWHAGLGNLCGPYSRAYGMDLHSYVGGLALALWCAGLPAPMPALDADLVPHGHDVCMTPMLEHVGVRVPQAVRPAFDRFTGSHAVRQVIESSPRRAASGWLEDALMIGGEDGDTGLQARGQFHPATVHWRQPGGTVGWLRVEHHGSTRARAAQRQLVVECEEHPRRGAQPVRWIANTTPDEIRADRWVLPGLDVEVETTAALSATAPPTYSYAPAATTTFNLRLTPTP